MDEPASATLAVLGPFAATDGSGQLLALPKKAQGLLAFVACNHVHPVRRDDLAALLWNDKPSAEARHSLRQCLATLRKSLGAAGSDLSSQEDAVALAPDSGLRIDIARFAILEASPAVADLALADALFRGEFLQGLSVRSEPFDDWLRIERQNLCERRLTVLRRLCSARSAAGDFEDAIRAARKMTSLDPYREDLHRLLLEVLAASGQRGLALVEHARVEQRLREDLGLAPDNLTRQLAENIRTGALGPSSSSVRGALTPSGVLLRRPSGSSVVSEHPVVRFMPFRALGHAPELMTFASALSDDLAAALHRERWPVRTVIATYRIAARSTPADYEVSGSVRREQDRLRVSLQLSNVASGLISWAHTIETNAGSLLDASDETSAQLTGRLGVALRHLEMQQVKTRSAELSTGYALYLRASALCRSGRSGNAEALELLRLAIEIEPALAPAYALSARCLHLRRLMGWAHPSDPALKQAVRMAHHALEIDAQDPEVLWMAGLALANVDGNATEGRALVAQSLKINPNNASAWIASAFVHTHSGEPQTGLAHFERAQQANPDDGSQHVQWHAAAMAHFVSGNYEEAEQATDRALMESPYYPGSLRLKVATSAMLGRIDDAQGQAKHLLRVNPDAGLNSLGAYWQPWSRYTPDAFEAMLTAWRRIGMPD